MEVCGNCKHCRVGYLTGTTICDISKKDVIGYFATPCEHYENNQEQPKTSTAMEQTTNTTKVCKICGRSLPLDSFPKHPRTKDGHSHICAECLKAKNASSIQAAIDARKGKKTKETSIDGKEFDAEQHRREICPHLIKGKSYSDLSIKHYTDQQLYDELIRRGWTGTLTRTETLAPEF